MVHPNEIHSPVPRFLVVVAVFSSAFGCASSNRTTGRSSTQETAGSRETTTEDSEEERDGYGRDPMGTARKWVGSPPDDVGDETRERLESWKHPVVERIWRVEDGSYRALVSSPSNDESDALILTVESDGRDWQVTRTKWVSGSVSGGSFGVSPGSGVKR